MSEWTQPIDHRLLASVARLIKGNGKLKAKVVFVVVKDQKRAANLCREIFKITQGEVERTDTDTLETPNGTRIVFRPVEAQKYIARDLVIWKDEYAKKVHKL